MVNEHNYVSCPKCGHDRNASTLSKCEICGQPLKKSGIPAAWIGLVALLALGSGYFVFKDKFTGDSVATDRSVAAPSTTAPSKDLASGSINQVELASDRKVDYSKLQEYLQQKDWKAADRETYLRMLDAAGPKAQAAGMTPQAEMDTLPCTDLKRIDSLWSAASDGQQGFTIQMNIFRGLGTDYRKMYDKVEWQKLPPSNEWLFEVDYNPQTRKMEFKPGKEPNYKTPLQVTCPLRK